MNAVGNHLYAAAAQMGLLSSATTNAPFVPLYPSAADPSLSFNPRKRPREDDTSVDINMAAQMLLHQQGMEVDRLIALHTEKVRAELAERRRRYWQQAAAAVEEGVAKRLRAKEEEVERIGKLNWALEERIRSLCVENQIWRDLAQSNEAAVAVLRSNLEQVLAAKAEMGCGAEAAEDAESCCSGDRGGEGRRVCRRCGEGEPSVLLLPCRHLCLCAACGPAVVECPVCRCGKDGSVNVNIV